MVAIYIQDYACDLLLNDKGKLSMNVIPQLPHTSNGELVECKGDLPTKWEDDQLFQFNDDVSHLFRYIFPSERKKLG